MEVNDQSSRLSHELQKLERLKASSTLFDFETEGNPPDRYLFVFRGKGLHRGTSSSGTAEIAELHQVDVRLPFSFPTSPPDIRWLTPLFHPNVSYSGFVSLREIELPWNEDLGLDAIAERLWDMVRLAYVNLDKATNSPAKKWLQEQCTFELPLDSRRLADRESLSPEDIQFGKTEQRPIDVPKTVKQSDVYYIGEDTPVPELPVQSQRFVRRRGNDGDVLYIGDE